ncbi:ankyrin repeat and SAM domain-containing protein 4B [Mastacembelus armatus]|uniref:Ankyrin repeat and sterile alpha motif domain containing 4B n=1 Tax=Mastacembelus armatus TaxID=205130 RepID=A0A3Q3T289_9TELE|nr:ankyrin repeat and SAM domain-containing protein 4B [Mastacembelus armatus]XP_026180853.1 ankyrin repeat and SAM domain-containing protein 4B [Mastacembelus armatus]
MSRYHKAAVDGYLDLLKEATRKDLNTPDEDGMTPTLLAAFHGHVDALQLICSREGDPNKSDIWGNTPLHHAAANGHMHILSFLVNFGVNLFALDNEFHTAMDVAASRDRMDCVRFLDVAASQQINQNPKKVAFLKKEAIKEAEKRVKLCEKVKKKHQSKMDKMYRGAGNTGSVSEASMASSLSNSGTLSGVNDQFSKLIAADKSGSLTARVKGTLQKKLGKKDKGTVQKLGGDGNVIFLKQENGSSEKPEFLDVFNEQDEDMLDEEGMAPFEDEDNGEPGQVKQSIFNRPGLGGLTFMKKMGLESEDVPRGTNESLGYLIQNELFEPEEDAVGAEGNGDADLPWEQEDLGLDDDEDEETTPLDAFLSAISLPEFALAFSREHLDLEALMLCSDEDLKGIRIQLGPRKKILEAVSRRKNALETPGIMKDSCL